MSDKISYFTDPELRREILQNARERTFLKDAVLMYPGAEIVFIPIVIRGSIRIIRQEPDGKEVFLYHLYPGQTCALSLSCCQAGRKSMVRAVAEDDTEVLQIPVQQAADWDRYPEWKAYVSANYQNRFAELLQVIDLIAFSHLDKQLLHYLEERSKALNSKVLSITHQEIADELGTHREAVSRLLRTMEQKNLVKLGRNNIELPGSL